MAHLTFVNTMPKKREKASEGTERMGKYNAKGEQGKEENDPGKLPLSERKLAHNWRMRSKRLARERVRGCVATRSLLT